MSHATAGARPRHAGMRNPDDEITEPAAAPYTRAIANDIAAQLRLGSCDGERVKGDCVLYRYRDMQGRASAMLLTRVGEIVEAWIGGVRISGVVVADVLRRDLRAGRTLGHFLAAIHRSSISTVSPP